jgi:D-glycero-D-manno-heptose 1,7-bisphosphate phosphatase
MNRAVFLDRDGVINKKGRTYYVFDEEDFVFNDGVAEALSNFQSKGFLLIIITNQGGIAKGIYSVEQLEKLHNTMKTDLLKSGIKITDIFYCPHHPDISSCRCRKPGVLLFQKAIEKYDIDPASSFMIGDSEIDTQAAEKMGIKGILIPTNGNMMNVVESGLVE